MNKALGQNRVQVLRTSAEVEALRGFWESCNTHRDADLDFFLFIVALYPETLRPCVFVHYEDDVPKAILAGRLDLGHVPIRLGSFSLHVPKMKILQIVHGGWLGDISDAGAEMLIRGIIESLASGEADAALLHCPNLSSPLVRYARSLPHAWNSDYLVTPQYHRVRNLPRTPDAFLASLSRKERYNQRKREKDIKQQFHDHRIDVFTTLDELPRLIRDAETIAKRSYQRRLGVGFSETPVVRSRLKFEAEKGWLRGYILYLDGQPSAFWIASLRNQVFLSDYLAYDPAFAKFGPGMYLTLKIIEGLCNDQNTGPVDCVDFGIGDASWKERLSNCSWQESPLYIFAPNVKSVGVNTLRLVIGTLNNSLKTLLRKTLFLEKIKRMWRTRQPPVVDE